MLKIAFATAALTTLLTGCFENHVLTQAERMTAEIGARRFAEPTGERFSGCSTQDKNGDGLITCTIVNPTTLDRSELLCGYRESKIGCTRKK